MGRTKNDMGVGRIMKRIISIILMISMVFFLYACSSLQRNTDLKDKGNHLKIGVSVYDHYDTFISEVTENMEKKLIEMESEYGITISMDIENAANSQIEQNSQIEDFINNGCDVICVNLVDRTDPSMIIDKARSADIPVIFFNRELVEEDLERWDKLYYVGAVALESGIMQGKIVAEISRDNFQAVDRNGDGVLQYVMLEGEAGHQDAIMRTEYSVNTVTEEGFTVEKMAYAIANWNRAQAQTKMSLWIEQLGEEIEVVFANNDDMALGAIDAYKLSDVTKLPMIVGIDGTTAGLEAVKEGTLSGTVYNDGVGQASAMLELSYAIVTNHDLPTDIELKDGKYIRLPHQIVTKDNLEKFLE